MKRSSFIKIASVLLIAAMMFGSVTVFAELSAVTPDQTTNKVTITGKIAASNMDIEKGVHLSIHGPDATDTEIDNGAKLIDSDMVLVKAGASYSITFTMPATAESGTYKVVEGGAADTTIMAFYFASIGTKESVLALIKAAAAANDATAMRDILDQYADVIQIGGLYKDLSSDGKGKLAKEMAANTTLKNMSTGISAMTIANEAGIQAYLVQALNENKVADAKQFNKYLDTFDNVALYDLFSTGITAIAQQAVVDRLSGKNLADTTALKAIFKEQTFLAAASYASSVADVNKVLNDYGSSFSELTNLASWKGATDKKRAEIAQNIISAKPSTLSALNTYLYVAPSSQGDSKGSSTDSTGGTTITVPATPAPTVAPPAYSDIAPVGWAGEAIDALTKLGVFNGYPDGTFRPNNPITREEFVKIITVCTYGTGVTDIGINPTFIDARDGWYSPFIDIAERKGLTNGIGDDLFGIGRNITRQEVAAMVYRMVVDKDYHVNTNDVNFTDAADIADYARACVNALANAEVIAGYGDGSFLPLGNTTRAEAAVMLYKACKLIGRF